MTTNDVRVLVVDDEPEILNSFVELFSTFRFQVQPAGSGNKAWELLQKEDFHLVLSDVRMHDGDGISLAKKVRARHPSKPSFLFLSGYSDLTSEELYHIGAEGFFAKPANSTAVKDAIQRCLLSTENRWNLPLANPSTSKIRRSGADVDSLAKDSQVIFGRGGFFISTSEAPLQIWTQVDFEIEIQGPRPLMLKGAGVVRWNQTYAKQNAPLGMGIEILNLGFNEAKSYQEMFGNLREYIPSPRLAKS